MNRQQFLRTGLGSLACTGISTGIFGQNGQHAVQPGRVSITNVRVFIHPKACFVKIETDAGVSGWGEADHDNTSVVARAILDIHKKLLVGKNIFDQELLWHEMLYRGEDMGLAGINSGAIAGIDNALWDAKGKLLNLPVHKLLGSLGAEKLKVYASFGRGEGKGIKTPEACGKTAAAFRQQGFDTIKIRMQLRTLNRNPEPDPTDQYVAAVRRAIGDDTTLFVDFNNGYTAGKAIDLIKRLYEKYNVALVEEPVHYKDYDALRQCVEASPIRIGAGEHEFNRWEIRDLITQGRADVINLDVIKGGGISEMKKASVLAQAFEREVMCHNARPTLATAATVHLAAGIFNAARVQEYGGERLEMELWPLFDNRFEYSNGYLTIPQAPGLGLQVNEKAMAPLEVK